MIHGITQAIRQHIKMSMHTTSITPFLIIWTQLPDHSQPNQLELVTWSAAMAFWSSNSRFIALVMFWECTSSVIYVQHVVFNNTQVPPEAAVSKSRAMRCCITMVRNALISLFCAESMIIEALINIPNFQERQSPIQSHRVGYHSHLSSCACGQCLAGFRFPGRRCGHSQRQEHKCLSNSWAILDKH